MGNIERHAQEARHHLGGVRTELQAQETLQLHAVLDPGSREETLRELAESRRAAADLMGHADALGLDAQRAARLRPLVIAYGQSVEQDVRARKPEGHDGADHHDEADHADGDDGSDAEDSAEHAQAHDLFHTIDAQLQAADEVLAARVKTAQVISDGGTVGVVLLSLGLTVLFARRRKVADVRRASERAVESRYRALVTESTDLVLIVDAQGRPSYASPSAHRALPDLLSGDASTVLDVVHPEDQRPLATLLVGAPDQSADRAAQVECRIPRPGGGWGTYQVSVADLRADPAVAGLVLTARDVSGQRELQRQIQHQALHDALTGLPNRRLLLDRLQHALARTDRTPAHTALLYLDLDGFKAINDSLGHATGDQVLEEVSRRLVATVRPADTVCRLGGDEFAVLLEETDADEAHQIAQRLLAALDVDLEVGGRLTRAAASIGIAVATHQDSGDGPALTGDELFVAADMAMYAAKRDSKSRIAHYRPDMYQAMLRRTGLERDLHHALARGEISVAYQPIVTILGPGTGTDPDLAPISGVEALMRWTSPTWGSVSPAEFIPIAEESGLIIPLGAHVLRTAAATVARWNADRPTTEPLDLSVNVSVRQLEADGFVRTVREILAETGLPASLLTVEVTESLLLREECAPVLTGLRKQGVRISLDDFGTGYAALGHLNALTVDQLKIDISFIRALGTETGNEELTASIIALAASLGLDAVAEGVESDGQLDHLQAMGCPHAQGYLFSRPLPAADLTPLLNPDTSARQHDPAVA